MNHLRKSNPAIAQLMLALPKEMAASPGLIFMELFKILKYLDLGAGKIVKY